ncbi:MAG: ATP-binding protein [Cyclobacteriaceae bacterium]
MSSAVWSQDQGVVSSDYGYPALTNYTPNDYKAHAQVWQMIQASNGLMYFGNGEGVLAYDGKAWTKYRSPNLSLVRALAEGADDRIYVGGAGEIGYLAPDEVGVISYHSLLQYLPEDKLDFNQARYVVYTSDRVYYATRDRLMIYDEANASMEVVMTEERIRGMDLVDNQVWLTTFEGNVLRYTDSKFITEISSEQLPDGGLFGLTDWGDSRIILFLSSGVYSYAQGEIRRLSTVGSDDFEDILAFNIVKLNDESFLASSKLGILHIGLDGRLINKMGRDEGLPEQNIHTVYRDQSGAVWASHNFGVTQLAYHQPFRKFDERNGLFDTVNDVLRWNGALYVSTHTALYKLDITESNQFQQVGAPYFGESFALEIINEELWVSTSSGIFKMSSSGKIQKVSNAYSYKFEQSVADPSVVYVPGVDGLIAISAKNGTYTDRSYKNDMPYDVRYLRQDSLGTLWLGIHANKLYTVDFYDKGTLDKPEVIEYSTDAGLPATHIPVHIIDGELVFSSEVGVFDRFGERFDRSTRFPKELEVVYYMLEAATDVVYVLNGLPPFMKVMPLVKANDGVYRKQANPDLAAYTEVGIWAPFEDMDGSMWFGLTGGLTHYFPDRESSSAHQPITNISSIKLNTDSVVAMNFGLFDREWAPTLDYEDNSIRFEYGLTAFDREGDNQFRYQLEGLEDDWSGWSIDHIREYVDLGEGDYSFSVEGRDVYGNIGKRSSFSFSIHPPWYRTWWFIILVVVMFAVVIALIARFFAQRKLIRRVEELELQQELQKERERISSDLHDHVGAQLTSIISGLSMTEQVGNLSQKDQLTQLIHSIKADAQHTMTNLRDSIWSLNEQSLTLTELFDHIDNYLEGYLKYHPQLSFSMQDHIDQDTKLGPKQALNIIRVVEEAIQNIVKHACAKHITVAMTVRNDQTEMTIKDDGKGFDPEVITGEHYGLDNMKRRMAEIQGAININSTPGAGSTLRLIWPNTL